MSASVVEPRASGKRPAPRARTAALLAFFVLLGLAVIAAIVAGALPRLARQKALAAEAAAAGDARPIVNVAPARSAAAKSELELPGDLLGLIETPIFARADGYMRKRWVDIGEHVKAGQVMADLETPELDQQVQSARATLAESRASLKELEANINLARANLKFAQVTFDRWIKLAREGVFSAQDADEKQAALEVNRAQLAAAEARLGSARETIRANEANLARLEQLKAYNRVQAPFDGIVTGRFMDVGTLVTAGNSREMFRVSQIDPMRIFVNVPQSNVGVAVPGRTALLTVQELPGRVFPAKVVRNTNSLDPGSRALLAVLMVGNPDGVLLPGMYAQVRFAVPAAGKNLVIPGDTLMLSRKGPRVAIVDAEHKVRLREIHIARDLGAEIEVDGGLAPGDLVVMNPTDAVREGAVVDMRTGKP